ncbi:hypothetical protein HAX54_031022 [Datura stramonium]|uniref:Uncharacterized protein n=1 Tax=Datura stramonium TaxID=4076 RepID=A0ABS8RL56_DATST|nr:hypothetical protein [Datura stramonium]
MDFPVVAGGFPVVSDVVGENGKKGFPADYGGGRQQWWKGKGGGGDGEREAADSGSAATKEEGEGEKAAENYGGGVATVKESEGGEAATAI